MFCQPFVDRNTTILSIFFFPCMCVFQGPLETFSCGYYFYIKKAFIGLNKKSCLAPCCDIHENKLLFCPQIQTGAVFLTEHHFEIIPLIPHRGSVTDRVCTQTCPSNRCLITRD